MSKIDIQIKQLEKREYSCSKYNLLDSAEHKNIDNLEKNDYDYYIPFSSKLVLQLSGSDNNIKICNTLRRVAMNDLPNYAFPAELIKISENTSVFNNDMMRLRLSSLPIIDTNIDFFFLEPKYWYNVNYADPKRLRHEQEKQIEISINIYNNTNKIRNVTTNDIHYYEEGQEIKKYDTKCPYLIIQLRPSETFKCSMKATFGTAERNNIWACCNAYYDDMTTDDIKETKIENKNNTITFTIESFHNNDEYDLLIKACDYIMKKMDDIMSDLNKKYQEKEILDTSSLILVLKNEDHTIGELMNYYFQNHPKILFSGVTKPDHSIKEIKFKILCSDDVKNSLEPMFEQMKHIKKVYTYIKNLLTKMSVRSDV